MIKTGEISINWDSFQTCSDKKRVIWIENGVETVIGSTSEEVLIDEKKDILHRKQELIFSDPNKVNRKIDLWIHLSNFEPISCTDEGPIDVSLSYNSNEIEVVYKEKGMEKTSKHNLPDGVFDLFSLELLLRLLPLEEEYKNELHAFNHMAGNIVPVKIEVIQKVKISDGTKEVDAWVVNLHFGKNLQTYWISCETKELLKQSIKVSEGVYFDFVR